MWLRQCPHAIFATQQQYVRRPFCKNTYGHDAGNIVEFRFQFAGSMISRLTSRIILPLSVVKPA